MGKKTISEKNKIRKNLDILMNLPQAIIDRNPKIKAFIKDNTPYTDLLQQKDPRLKALFKKNPLCKEICEADKGRFTENATP